MALSTRRTQSAQAMTTAQLKAVVASGSLSAAAARYELARRGEAK
jgi:hypothetical protein